MDLTWVVAAWSLLVPTAVASALVTEPATDYTGLALVVTASGAFFATVIGAVFTGVLALRASKKSERAEAAAALAATAAAEAKEVSVATGKAVDGKMDKLLAIATNEAALQATLTEKDAQRVRDGAAADAVLKQAKETASILAPVPAPSLEAAVNGKATADKVLSDAALRAKSLLEAAAVTAANLVIKAKEEADAKANAGNR